MSYKNPEVFFGDSSIILLKTSRIELIYLKRLRRFFKKLTKKYNTSYTTKRVWFFLNTNYQLSKKSKNARMGKGKGSFFRSIIRSKKYTTLFEFVGLNNFQLNKICVFFKKHTNIPVKSNLNVEKTYPQFSNKHLLVFFYKKYGLN